MELARAQIAWQLGKRYTQDQPLEWGCQVDLKEDPAINPHAYKPSGPTLHQRREREAPDGDVLLPEGNP